MLIPLNILAIRQDQHWNSGFFLTFLQSSYSSHSQSQNKQKSFLVGFLVVQQYLVVISSTFRTSHPLLPMNHCHFVLHFFHLFLLLFSNFSCAQIAQLSKKTPFFNTNYQHKTMGACKGVKFTRNGKSNYCHDFFIYETMTGYIDGCVREGSTPFPTY